VPEKQLGDVDAAPPAPAEGKPTVSAASEDLEGKAEPASDDPDQTGEGVNGDGS
jgi:proteasome alpha subunit